MRVKGKKQKKKKKEQQNLFGVRWESDMCSFVKDEGLDLTDRVAMVTGANSGLGKEIASFLAQKGCLT